MKRNAKIATIWTKMARRWLLIKAVRLAKSVMQLMLMQLLFHAAT
jgi:hypothetical protein